MEFGSQAWMDRWAVDGLCFEPAYWRSAEYLDNSCFTLDELDGAFAALARVFTPAVVRRIASEPRAELFWLLYNIEPARRSALVSLGLDLAELKTVNARRLYSVLGKEHTHRGARFEVEVWAAFQRAAIGCTHEPFRAAGGTNPDFRVAIGDGLVLDVKSAERALHAIENDALFELISGMYDFELPGICRHISFTALMESKLADPAERWPILRRKNDLAWAVKAEVLRLHQAGTFPAEAVVEGLIHICVDVSPDSGLMSSFSGAARGEEREATRLIQNLLLRGAEQIPLTHPGLVLIDIGDDVRAEVVAQAVERWLLAEGEGALYPHVLGAILVATRFVEGISMPLRCVFAVWRPDVPASYRTPSDWQRLTEGLNWHRLRELAWSREREKNWAKDRGGQE